MAWQHSGYILFEDDATAKRAELLLHIKEVADVLSDPKSQDFDGHGYTLPELSNYLNTLKKELKEVNAQVGLGAPKIFSGRVRGID